MTDNKPEPPPGYSAFKKLLGKLAKVPKSEMKQSEREYEAERDKLRKKAR